MNKLVLVLTVCGLLVSIFALVETLEMDSVEKIYHSALCGWMSTVVLFLTLIYIQMGN